MEKIIHDHMDVLGFGESPWIAVRHVDRPHAHVHVVALRLGSNYKTVRMEWNWEKAAVHLGAVSEKYGFRKVSTHRMRYEEAAPPSPGE